MLRRRRLPGWSAVRAAVTLEQCWHRVPGGTAVAALEVVAAVHDRGDVEVVGVQRGPSGPSARRVPTGGAGAFAAAAEDRALRGVARAAAAEGRAGDRAGRRRPRHHDRRPAPIGPAGRDRARPGVPPRARPLHAPRAADLPPRSRAPAPRRRPRAVLVDGDVGRSRGARRRRSTAAPRAAGRRAPSGPRPRRWPTPGSSSASTGPTSLFAGTVEPRKNLPRLVAAFERVRPSTPTSSWSWPDRAAGATCAVDRRRRPGTRLRDARPAARPATPVRRPWPTRACARASACPCWRRWRRAPPW